jgi:hypothetical protein
VFTNVPGEVGQSFDDSDKLGRGKDMVDRFS